MTPEWPRCVKPWWSRWCMSSDAAAIFPLDAASHCGKEEQNSQAKHYWRLTLTFTTGKSLKTCPSINVNKLHFFKVVFFKIRGFIVVKKRSFRRVGNNSQRRWNAVFSAAAWRKGKFTFKLCAGSARFYAAITDHSAHPYVSMPSLKCFLTCCSIEKYAGCRVIGKNELVYVLLPRFYALRLYVVCASNRRHHQSGVGGVSSSGKWL